MDVNKALENKMNPSETEVGMYNPISDVGIHARDDGCLELFAGGTSILIDGRSGAITINGKTINAVAATFNAKTDLDGFNTTTGAISPQFLPSWAEALQSVEGGAEVATWLELQRSPLTPANPVSLNTQIVVGAADPSKGQTNMRLRDLVQAKPLFRKLKRGYDIYKTIKKVVDELDEED